MENSLSALTLLELCRPKSRWCVSPKLQRNASIPPSAKTLIFGACSRYRRKDSLLGALKPVTATSLSDPIRLVRLTANGLRDPSFAAAVALSDVARPFPQLFAMVSAPGDKTILIGRFNEVNGVAQNDLARLNSDGSLDSSFQSGTGFEPPPNLSVKIGRLSCNPTAKSSLAVILER